MNDVERPRLAEDEAPEQTEEKFPLVTIMTDEGALLLHEKSEPVSFVIADNSGKLFLDKATMELIQALKDYVVENDGLGMAAIQLGVKKRVFVMRQPFNSDNIKVIINPKVLRGDGKAKGSEGCFSIPMPDGVGAMVQRMSRIFVTYDDEEGNRYDEELLIGMDARVFQHELDHLDGKLMVDEILPRGGKFKGFVRQY